MIYHRINILPKYICSLSIFIFLFCLQLFSQPVTEELEKKMADFYRNNPREKIYVHTDKSFYVPGEIIWFKAYVVDGRFHKPIDLSKVAYIEVLDKNNTPVLQAKIALQKGSGKGSFLIPVSVTTGAFRLRAYTHWMRNWDVSYFFEKSLTIVNTLKALPPTSTERTRYDIRFFPEGGNLVENIESKVAFKITDQYGKGPDASGTVINQRNDTVLRFKSIHAGMGDFTLIPKTGDSYKAIVNAGNDSSIVVSLPPAYVEGYVMHSEEAGNRLQLTVTASNRYNDETIYLLSHSREKTNIAEAKVIKENKAIFSIDKNILPAGVSVFTIFNSARQPVCERLCFKKPARLDMMVTADKSSYSTRSKVTLSIANNLPPQDGADLSISVYRIDSLQAVDNTDITSYLLLSSELKGTIESPEYYVMQPGDDVAKATDELMLTQGWRRFKWEDVWSGKKQGFQFIPEYEGHVIIGKITNKKTGLPAQNVSGYLSSPGRLFQFTSGVSDANGFVYFNTKDFMGTEQIIAQLNGKQNEVYRIDLLNPFSEIYNTTPLRSPVYETPIQTQLLNHSINSQVQTAYSSDSLNKFYFPYSDTSHFFGVPDRTYALDDYTRFTTMEEVLREYVLEVAPRRQSRKFHIYVLKNAHEFFGLDALVLIDGVPFFDMDSVMAVDPLKIKKIDVVTREYVLGHINAPGIISYSTYKGDLEGIRLDPNAVVIEYESLQLQREFYAPVYESNNQRLSRLPDFRNTLYWSPDVKTEGSQKKELSFYTSDLGGKYFILVQGVSGNGNIVSSSSSFEVIK
jgi:hypothetical protein